MDKTKVIKKLIDEYFPDDLVEDPSILKKHKLTIQDFIEYQKNEHIENLKKFKAIIEEKKEPRPLFPLDYEGLFFLYCPDEEYLTLLVEITELLLKEENLSYADIVFMKEINDITGMGIHTMSINYLVGDTKYFYTNIGLKDADKYIVSDVSRFTGLLPYLYNKGYKDLYERVFKVTKFIIERYQMKAVKLLICLLNFLKDINSSHYEEVHDIFLKQYKENEKAWHQNQTYYIGFMNGFNYAFAAPIEMLD